MKTNPATTSAPNISDVPPEPESTPSPESVPVPVVPGEKTPENLPTPSEGNKSE